MKVRKRNNRVVKFNPCKVKQAIKKALLASGEYKKQTLEKVFSGVMNKIKAVKKEVLHVEEIQDMIEETLVQNKLYKTSKAFILYRERKARARDFAKKVGVENDLKLPLNSFIVLYQRYLLRDENGEVKETPKQLFRRVARTIAEVEYKYGKDKKYVKRLEREFFKMMTNFEFLPNSPTLMNAGGPLGQLSACFVLPVEDSLEEIFNAVKWAAIIHKTGGGTGFSFSKLRPAGDVVRTTGGVASGPVSFMRVFDAATNEIKQGGKRRGANMGVLSVHHPDIIEFITCKSREGKFENFNISVAVTDEFMKALENDEEYPLINPRTGKIVRKIKAVGVWDLLITEAWKTGDPGLLFIDTINKSYSNCVKSLGPIEATNPCGELPLYPFESCNLGSINLKKMLRRKNSGYEIDWKKLRKTVRLAVRFLDNVIDANHYPLKQIEELTKSTRRIGLGVMGWAEMLILLGIPYASQEALDLAEKIMKFITEEARKESVRLGKEKGNFPLFERSIWKKKGYKYLRNSCVTAIAPTGSISIIANCSSGIEPLFAIVLMRNLEKSLGHTLIEINPLFEEIAVKEGFYSPELIHKIANKTSIQDVEEIPKHIRRLFMTAHDVSPEWHVRMQAAFQKYTDNAVSKTVNLPYEATPHDVEKVYWLAYRLGCKGITVFRDRCRSVQVLTTVKKESKEEEDEDVSIYGKCRGGKCVL